MSVLNNEAVGDFHCFHHLIDNLNRVNADIDLEESIEVGVEDWVVGELDQIINHKKGVLLDHWSQHL